MRDVLLALFVLLFISMAFRHVFASYLVWTWTAVVFPTAWVYGFMTSSRLNLLFALLTLVMMVVHRQRLEKWAFHRTTVLILIFLAHATICAAFGLPNNPNNATYYETFIKSLLLALLLPVFVNSRLRLQAFLCVLVLGFGFLAGLEGLRSMYTLGTHPIRGIHVGMLSDNNHFAAGIVTFLPIAIYMAQHAGNKHARLLLWALVAVTVFCVLGTRSRGGFVALMAVGLVLILVSRQRIKMLLLSTVLGALFVAYAPSDILGRLDTIQTAKEEDRSFQGRLIAWRTSSALAMDRPLIGGGFHAVQAQTVWNKYAHETGLFVGMDIPSDQEPHARAAHSIYFEVMGDLGFVGFFMFLLLLANAFWTIWRLGRITRKRPELQWARDLAFTLMLCLVGYSVAGAAVSLAYLEFFYILLMLVEVVRQLVNRQLAAAPVQGAVS